MVARITVIDGYPDIRELLSAVLDGLEGHEVTVFDGDGTTVEDLVASRPNLLIIDLRVAGGGASNEDTLALIGSDERLRNVPFIISSGDVVALRRRSDELARLTPLVLEKPFSLEHLTAIVSRGLDGKVARNRSTDASGDGNGPRRNPDAVTDATG